MVCTAPVSRRVENLEIHSVGEAGVFAVCRAAALSGSGRGSASGRLRLRRRPLRGAWWACEQRFEQVGGGLQAVAVPEAMSHQSVQPRGFSGRLRYHWQELPGNVRGFEGRFMLFDRRR